MSLFGRYIFRQAAGALLLILLSLTGITWIALALKQLNVVTSQGQDAWMFVKLTLLAIPNLMALIAPIALLIAAIHTINRLNQDSELIVLTASGASVWRVARPLLALALVVSILLSISNHLLLPWSMRELNELVIKIRTDLISQVIQPGRFSSPEAGLTFHIRDRNEQTGELYGIIMQDARDQKQTMSYLAERGLIVKQDGEAFLVMSDGHIVRREKEPEPGKPGAAKPTEPKAEPGKAEQPPQIIQFQRYIINMNRFEPKTAETELRPRERYWHELVNPTARDKEDKLALGKLRSELHERFAGPLYPFVFVMIVIALVGQAQTTRQNRVQSVIIAFVIAAACRLGGLAAINLLTLKTNAVNLVYGVPVLSILIATFVAHARMHPLPTPAWVRRLSEAADNLRQRLGSGPHSDSSGGAPPLATAPRGRRPPARPQQAVVPQPQTLLAAGHRQGSR